MEDVRYFASLTRAENARCDTHRHGHGYAGPFICRDCVAAQGQALRFERTQRQLRASVDDALDLFALAEDRVRGVHTGAEVAA